MVFFLTLGVTIATIVGWWVLASRAKPKLPYPPGPKGLPFIGNVLDIDPQNPRSTYAQWNKTFGDIVYIRVFGQDIIFVNSEKTARILADGRSEIYSDRYRSSIYKHFGTSHMTFVLEYGKEWKTHRRFFHLSLRNDVVDRYNDLHLNHARQLSENILRDHSNSFEHLDLYANAIITELIYGRRVEGKDDPVFVMANALTELLNKEVTPDRIGLVKVMPFPVQILKVERKARQCRRLAAEMVDLPFTMAKDELERGVLPHCMISDMLKQGRVEESSAKAAISSVYLDVQDKVHAELDTVVGRGTIPTFADRPRLPYLQAVLYEVMRWNPPSSLAYSAMKDHGYDDPDRFDPTRHLTPDGQLRPESRQHNLIFYGFGKRVCPGRFFADHAIWAAAVVMMSTLKFGKAKDPSGNYIEVEPVFPNSLVSCPAPFSCSVTSRLAE
ncbi:cytochrome P450 [Pisolithus albus]|nr:cytochrome P450 [Pisolithus albus]